MKVSLNWLREYIELDLAPEAIAEILTDIGLEVEGMEVVESIPGGLEGIVVGMVRECQSHPNADKLSLTRVDIGAGELLPIVCGAPNVAAGQKVLVATVGTTLYPKEGEPWKIREGKIRGELSAGMICAEDEVGLGDDHSGILVLPEEVEVGTPASDYFQVERDVVFEIGLTPNRSDATNHIGVARDLAAALRINHGHSGQLKLPSLKGFRIENKELEVSVQVENTKACPRYSGLVIDRIRVGESPDWLKNRLTAIGLRPINNIVDITNFVLHEYGQPLHAFDLDEITGRKIIVKTLPEGTPFQALDETERKLSDEDLMICDGESRGMCIGGVFGGLTSGVKDGTSRIFLESAHFNPTYIRRSKTRHNLHTDAAFVFEKGSDPNITVDALKRASILIGELAGGVVSSGLIDIYPEKVEPAEIRLRLDRVNRLIGMEIPANEIRDILEAMDMEIRSENKMEMLVAIPTNKSDVTREADLIEEILRIYGLNKVPIPAQIRSTMTYSEQPDPREVENTISDILVGNGFQEMMGLSLIESRYCRELLPIEEEELVFINNTSNVQLDLLRPVMLFNGLEAILRNQNRQRPDNKLFEFGRTYRKQEGKIREDRHLTLFLSGDRLEENWLNKVNPKVDFYTLKAFVRTVLERVGLQQYQETAIQDAVFAYGMKYHRGQQNLVEFGKVISGIQKGMDLKNDVFYADFHWDNILKAIKKHKVAFTELNKYPGTRRDLAMIVENSVKFEDIVQIGQKAGRPILQEINLFDVFVDEEKLGKGKRSYAVSFHFENPERTLSDKEVDKVMNKLIQSLETKLNATIRR